MNNTAQNFQQDYDKPDDILTHCTQLVSFNDAYSSHPLIQRFGSPLQPIYINPNTLDINGVTYEQPLILPIHNGHLEPIQYAVLEDGKRVEFTEGGIAKGFASYGDLHHDKPIIVTHSLEAFFKVAQTGYAVALVVLPTLCKKHQLELKPFDFEQIQFVINQLSKAGYTKLYLPVIPEQIHLEPFKALEQNTAVRLLNQYLKIGVSQFYYQFIKDEDTADIQAFIEEAIEALPEKTNLPKGHLAKPFKYGDGVFHLLENGLYYIEQTKDDEYKRYISSPIKVLAQTRDTTNNAWGRLLEWYDADGIKIGRAHV